MTDAPPSPPSPPSSTLACPRCNRPEAPALPKPPLYGPMGKEIQGKVCADCWAEWQKTEVMVINELRLNFMDPASSEIITRHMREFLFLDPPTAGKPSLPTLPTLPPGAGSV